MIDQDMIVHGGKVRRHGFQKPFSPQQLLSWIIAAFIFISFVITATSLISLRLENHNLVPDSDYRVMISLSICYFISFLAMVVTTAIVTGSDPTDPTVALERLYMVAKENGMATWDFNSDDYHFHCDICDTHVLKNTKHC